MENLSNRLINSNLAVIFLFAYGLIAQIVSLPVIYYFSSIEAAPPVLGETLIYIWFCIPIVAIFSIILALVQIKERSIRHEAIKMPLIGLVLNILWLIGYLSAVYMIFFVVKPF